MEADQWNLIVQANQSGVRSRLSCTLRVVNSPVSGSDVLARWLLSFSVPMLGGRMHSVIIEDRFVSITEGRVRFGTCISFRFVSFHFVS